MLKRDGRAEAGWQGRSPRSFHVEAKGRRMRLPGWMRPPVWLRLPGRTVRVRLTALYGIMFVVSGALLLAIASGVAVVRSSSVSRAVPGPATTAPGTALDRTQARIHHLQAQVQNLQAQVSGQPGQGRLSRDLLIASLFALAVMTVVSAALGWLVPGRALRPVRQLTAVAKAGPAAVEIMALATRLRTELDRIDRLLEAFLVLARAQHRGLPGQAILPLDYMTANALTDQATAISARRLTVQETSGPGGAWVTGSPALISRMVENVGPVLGQEQVRELSRPFRRTGAERTGSDNGSGLGLSIVAAIAEAHGGSLDLRARPGGGLRVCILLPAIHGDALCQMITDREDRSMVLMLTAAGTPGDRVSGLGLGADDYLGKPFHFAELVLRIRALARRQPAARGRILRAAGVELDQIRLGVGYRIMPAAR